MKKIKNIGKSKKTNSKFVPLRYKSKWKSFSLNKKFWREVFLNRKIVGIKWDDFGIKSLILDNGEKINLTGNKSRISIVLHQDSIKE